MIKTKYFAENFVSDLTIKYGEWLKTMQTGIDADINKFTIISTTGYYNTVGVHCLIITYSVG